MNGKEIVEIYRLNTCCVHVRGKSIHVTRNIDHNEESGLFSSVIFIKKPHVFPLWNFILLCRWQAIAHWHRLKLAVIWNILSKAYSDNISDWNITLHYCSVGFPMNEFCYRNSALLILAKECVSCGKLFVASMNTYLVSWNLDMHIFSRRPLFYLAYDSIRTSIDEKTCHVWNSSILLFAAHPSEIVDSGKINIWPFTIFRRAYTTNMTLKIRF
jgi:hypothetical protein